MKKILTAIIIVICIIFGVFVGINVTQKPIIISPLSESKSVIAAKPSPKPNLPITISIPKINLQTNIESVGTDSAGRMDVPKNWNNAAWYNKGPIPGQAGSAVIDGHVDNPQGKPAAFWNIKKLQSGNTIIITDKKGKTYTFLVSQVIDYPLATMPLQTIFNSTGTPKLNLITCSGVWDRSKHEYTERTVVYSELEKDRR